MLDELNLAEGSIIEEAMPSLQEPIVEFAGIPQDDIEVLKTRIVAAKCDSNYLRCDKGYQSLE